MKTSFDPTFQSLTQYECPAWFRDAKFGIWSHWGPQSVPMYGYWYARNMYIQDHPQYLYHIRHYGHPSQFGYKDICALWKAENFDPDGLMALYKKAGARYFVGQAMHHDHFFNYPSKLNRFNSMAMGPKKDICGLWKAAAEKAGLPFGLTEHLSATFSWWKTNKWCDAYGPYKGVPYDGNDPEYRDFYLDNGEHAKDRSRRTSPWYTSNTKFHDYWLAVMKEVIEWYQPDLLYSDGALPFGTREESTQTDAAFAYGLETVATLYNTSIAKHGQNRAVYNQKDTRPEIYSVGVLDIEKSQLPGIQATPWQTDTCIGNWFYDVRQTFKQPSHVIEMLIDIVSKNGCMLLNILQKPDGSIDDETRYLLSELADWFAINSEAIHGTTPWRTFAEGDSTVLIQGFKEEKVAWNSSDYRFTFRQGSRLRQGSGGQAGQGSASGTLYAFMLAAPENRVAVIKSLTRNERVGKVSLLGAGECAFSQAFGTLTVELPDNLPSKHINTLAIELDSTPAI